jgi:hypothetical protein
MKMGTYCKAYPVERFEAFPQWPAASTGSKAAAAGEDPLGSYYFLQDNFTVTRGPFLDEEVVFADVTPAWTEFCTATLGFELPEFLQTPDAAPAEAAQ